MTTFEEKKATLLSSQYKAAIDARDKHNENYHRWIPFYYVANGAILVAVTTLFGKSNLARMPDCTLLILGGLGVLTCMYWNLTCRGYYYWSLSWIGIIMYLERQIFKGEEYSMPYGVFSKSVALNNFTYLNSTYP